MTTLQYIFYSLLSQQVQFLELDESTSAFVNQNIYYLILEESVVCLSTCLSMGGHQHGWMSNARLKSLHCAFFLNFRNKRKSSILFFMLFLIFNFLHGVL